MLLYAGGPVGTGKCLEPTVSGRKRACPDDGASESFVEAKASMIAGIVKLSQGNLLLMLLFDMGNPSGTFRCYERTTSEWIRTEKSHSTSVSAVVGKAFLFLEG